MHTARWPQDLDVTGKRVAVVGAGSSAIQVIPAIQPRKSISAGVKEHANIGMLSCKITHIVYSIADMDRTAILGTAC